MQTRLQFGRSKRDKANRPQTGERRAGWLRLLALLCLLLVSVASTVQVCHVHGELASTSGNSRDSRDSRQTVPDHCPLCAAMHSALPTTAHTDTEPVLQVQTVLLQAVQVARVQRWSYELFSRPPPVVSSQA